MIATSITLAETTNIKQASAHINELPQQVQEEVFAYIDFLRQRQQQKQRQHKQSHQDHTIHSMMETAQEHNQQVYTSESINNNMDNEMHIDMHTPKEFKGKSAVASVVKVKKSSQKQDKTKASKKPLTTPLDKKNSARQYFSAMTKISQADDLADVWNSLVEDSKDNTNYSARFETWYQNNELALQLIDQNWAQVREKERLSVIKHKQIFYKLYNEWGDHWERQPDKQQTMQEVKNSFYAWRAENEYKLLANEESLQKFKEYTQLSTTEHELAIQDLYDELEENNDVMTSKEILTKIDERNRFLAWKEQYEQYH